MMVLQDLSRRFLSLLLLLLLVSVLFLTCLPAPQAHADSGSVTVVWQAANGAILGSEEVGIANVTGCQALSAPSGAAQADVTNATESAIDNWSNTNCTGTQTTIQSGAIEQQVTCSHSFNVP